MKKDEQAIREVVRGWWDATRRNDTDAILKIVAEDALFFLAHGMPPLGKRAFEQQIRGLRNVTIDGRSEILDIDVDGNQAWVRAFVEVKMTPAEGKSSEHKGFLFAILRKELGGSWVIYREANNLPAMDMLGMGQKRRKSTRRSPVLAGRHEIQLPA